MNDQLNEVVNQMVLYYFSNGKDRIYGELITILSEQKRDGVHIPIHYISARRY